MSTNTGRAPRVEDAVDRGDEGQRGHQHLVAGPDAERLQDEMQPRRAGIHRDGIGDVVLLGERLLEGAHLRPHRDPAAVDDRSERRLLILAEDRLGHQHHGVRQRRVRIQKNCVCLHVGSLARLEGRQQAGASDRFRFQRIALERGHHVVPAEILRLLEVLDAADVEPHALVQEGPHRKALSPACRG